MARYCVTCSKPIDNDPYARDNRCRACIRREKESQERQETIQRDMKQALAECAELPLCIVHPSSTLAEFSLVADKFTKDKVFEARIAVTPTVKASGYRGMGEEPEYRYDRKAVEPLLALHQDLVRQGWRPTRESLNLLLPGHHPMAKTYHQAQVPDWLYRSSGFSDRSIAGMIFTYRYAPDRPYDYFYKLLHIDMQPYKPPAPPKKKRFLGLW